LLHPYALPAPASVSSGARAAGLTLSGSAMVSRVAVAFGTGSGALARDNQGERALPCLVVVSDG
jgi:hypothetical protein